MWVGLLSAGLCLSLPCPATSAGLLNLVFNFLILKEIGLDFGCDCCSLCFDRLLATGDGDEWRLRLTGGGEGSLPLLSLVDGSRGFLCCFLLLLLLSSLSSLSCLFLLGLFSLFTTSFLFCGEGVRLRLAGDLLLCAFLLCLL